MGYPTTKLYPGELLQGAVGRLVGNYGLDPLYFNRKVLEAGTRIITVRSAVNFTVIDHIWRHLWPEKDPIELLRDHTLAPMLTWRRLKVNISVQEVPVAPDRKWSLLVPTHLGDHYYKFCPKCWQNQKLRYGERYWETIWQIPGVNVCPHHKRTTALRVTNIRLDARNVPAKWGFVTPELCRTSHQMEIGPDSYFIVNTARELIRNAPLPAVTTSQWIRYIIYLIEHDRPGPTRTFRWDQRRRIKNLICNYCNLGDFKWWSWAELLKVVFPDKKFVSALRECAEMNS